MKEPPPPDEKGVACAATLTTPDRAPSVGSGKQNSKREYTLRSGIVNPPATDAEPRVSEAGAVAADYVTEAEKRFFQVCLENTGVELSDEIYEKRLKDRRLLIAQSDRIAKALESQGIKAFGESNLAMVGVCSGEVIELPDYRNIVFIPSVAQRKRHRLLKHLEYFLQQNPYSRMWVFTSGERTQLSAVRARIQQLHRRLSKLNAEPFMVNAGVRIVFRSTELGEVERDETGDPTFHIHAHTIIHIPRKLSKEKWSELLKSVRHWWKFHFSDSKRIHQARETCKYVVKPGELNLLTDPELAELHHQLFRLHLVQCLGNLKEQKKLVESERKKFVRTKNGNESQWEIVDSWEPKRTSGNAKDDDAITEGEEELLDWILCTLPPSYAISKRAEPLAVVMNPTGRSLSFNRRFRALRDVCGAAYADCPESTGEVKENPFTS